jgi:dCTP deaminase
MGILSDKDIKSYIKEGKLSIEPFSEDNLTPNGYDLTIEEVFIPGVSEHVKDGVAQVASKQTFLVSTKEYVKLSGEITAQLWIRTTYARLGILGSFGKVDAGFEGNLTLSAFNASANNVDITIKNTFAQMIFERMQSTPEELYEKRSGTYMGQKGVTLGRTNSEENSTSNRDNTKVPK